MFIKRPNLKRSSGIGLLWLIVIALAAPGISKNDASAGSDQALLTSTNIRDRFLAGSVTAVEVVRQTIAKIESQDDNFQAVIAIDQAGLMAQAAKLDQLTPTEKDHRLLAALPILLKDNIESGALPTTAGSLALANNYTGRDAPLVT